jgi:hypothetical protein
MLLQPVDFECVFVPSIIAGSNCRSNAEFTLTRATQPMYVRPLCVVFLSY